MKLPARTVERLSQYRRVLQKYKDLNEAYIFSHDLARLMHLTAVQIRRDMMLLGISGNYRNGYNVIEILKSINETLTIPKAQKATIIGMGDLGKALLKHIGSNPSCPVLIPVTFDINPLLTNKSYHMTPCVDFTKSAEYIQKYNIKIAIISIVTTEIQEIIDSLIVSGIKSILNFSGGPFRVPEGIYLKDYDIRTTMDEISYFISQE
ncbi:MAG: redox-sensing transcriptional repressor Rex [Bacteroidales bacterium]|nr:redox-sensing transcriptional repressor Rex [Bacteroidales bacterium]MCF8402754.1 redox-sensing transcriptional repressor Rex [Bacteroidales bacterium]